MQCFNCPRCGAVSYNFNDLEQGYCGRCHKFTGAFRTPCSTIERQQPMDPEIIEELILKFRLIKLDVLRAQLEDDLDSDIESEARLRFVYVREFVDKCLEEEE